MSKQILLTGATGTVGQAVIPVLKEQGHQLTCLVRDLQRATNTLGELCSDVELIRADVEKPLCGLGQRNRNRLRGRVDVFLHLAGSIKFDEHLSEDTRRTNVDGTANVIATADELEVGALHYMSTAYVAGSREALMESEGFVGQSFHNEYERSKLEAEELIHQWGGRHVIYRMSIMVGDSKDGHIAAFNGYYGFFVSFWRLRQMLLQMWKEDQSKLREVGISFDGEQLTLPLHMNCSLTSQLNLIPADWLASTLSDLIVRSPLKQTYHLVHPETRRVQWIIEESLKRLNITGLTYGDPAKIRCQTGLLVRLQLKLDRELTRYLPYVSHGAYFEDSNLRRVLGKRYVEPAKIDRAMIDRLLTYAELNNFGKDQSVAATS